MVSAGAQKARPALVKHPFVSTRRGFTVRDMEDAAAASRQACSDVQGTEAAAEVIARGMRMADFILLVSLVFDWQCDDDGSSIYYVSRGNEVGVMYYVCVG